MILIWLFACTNPQAPYKDVLSSLGTKIFVPTYQEVEEKTLLLKEEVDTFCLDPRIETISVVQDAWWNARAPWKRMEFLNIGPYKEPDRLGTKIDFWPLRPDTIDEILLGNTELSEQTILQFPAATKGFPAIEYLLYSEQNLTAPRYCEYLQALSFDLHYHSQLFHSSWDPSEGNYLSHLVEAGADKDYISSQEAITVIINRLGHTIANIRALKLQKPLGENVGAVQADLLESRYSQRSLQDIKDNLQGISAVYHGSEAGLGIHDLLEEDNNDINQNFDQYLSLSMTTLEQLENQGSLEETMLIDSNSIDYLSERLGFLKNHIQEDILLSLSLWLTFNDSDGD